MKKFLRFIPVIAVFAFVGCGGTSTDGSSSGDAMADLSDGNIAGAQATFCGAIENGSTTSQNAFGCFLTKFLLLPETADAQALLAALGETNIDVETEILQGILNGYNSGSSDVGFDTFRYQNFPNLPLNGILTSVDIVGKGKNFAAIVSNLVATGTTSSQFQDMIFNFLDDFEELESLLDLVLAESSFSFTVPKETFFTDTDLNVSMTDAKLFMSSIKSSIVGLNVFAAYDYGLQFSPALNADGTDFDYEVLVADLNGTGKTVNGVTVDATTFLTLTDESLITNSLTRATEAIELALEGFLALASGTTSDLLDQSLEDVDLNDMVALFNDLHDSISEPVGLEALSIVDKRVVLVDLLTFFTNPPSAADVFNRDPFDYDSDANTIRIVEAYFGDLLIDTGVALWSGPIE